MLGAIACLTLLPGERDGLLGWTFGAIVIMFFLQLPASLVVTGSAAVINAPLLADERVLFRLLTAQWFLTACMNYWVSVYALPTLGRWIESRWPFERTYFRRQHASSHSQGGITTR
jgi:hypothetical protein